MTEPFRFFGVNNVKPNLGNFGLLALAAALAGCGGGGSGDSGHEGPGGDDTVVVPVAPESYRLAVQLDGLLAGGSITLVNEDQPGAEAVTLAKNGTFVFGQALKPNDRYRLNIAAVQSPEKGQQLQECGVEQGDGQAQGEHSELAPVLVTCKTWTYFPTSGTGNPPRYNQLWKTDGTAAGTSLVKQFASTSYMSAIRNLTVFKNRLFLAGGDDEVGNELYVVDATGEGAPQLIKDIRVGSPDNLFSLSSSPSYLTPVGDLMYFTALGDDRVTRLYYTDGTVGSATPVALEPAGAAAWGAQDSVQPQHLIAVDGKVYFLVVVERTDASSGQMEISRWLYRSAPGAETAKPVAQVADPSLADVLTYNGSGALQRVGQDLFFVANIEKEKGLELYRLRHGAERPERLTDILDGSAVDHIGAGTAHTQPANLRQLGNKLYFTISDPARPREHLLYRLDASADKPAAEAVSWQDQGISIDSPLEMTSDGQRMYVLTVKDKADGKQSLLQITADGEITAMARYPYISRPVQSGERVYFMAGEKVFAELYSRYADKAGVVTLKHGDAETDVFDLPLGEYIISRPTLPLDAQRVLLTIANDAWVTDGTPAGTQQLLPLQH